MPDPEAATYTPDKPAHDAAQDPDKPASDGADGPGGHGPGGDGGSTERTPARRASVWARLAGGRGQRVSETGSGFRPDVEGLRAVAVGLVVLYHAGLASISGGYVGVDVFFVISGFVITMTLARELDRRGTISIAGFYARRATRLLPAATAVILVTLVAAWLWLPPVLLRDLTADALASTLYAINYRLASVGIDYFATETPSLLQHYWSLAVEEQFYLVWPLLLIGLAVLGRGRSRQGRRALGTAWTALALVAIIVASFAACVALTRVSLPWAYFGAPTRAWELALGALVAVGARRLARVPAPVAAAVTWLGLAAIVAAALAFDGTTSFPGYAAMLPVAGAALVIAGGCRVPRHGAEALLRIAPLQWIGKLSYSWYLWHWPVFMIAPWVLDTEPRPAQRLLLTALSLGLAALSFTVLENPIRTAKALRAVPWKGISVGASFSAGTVAAALVAGLLIPPTVGTGDEAEEIAATIAREAGVAEPSGSGAGQGAALTAEGVQTAQQRLTAAVAAGTTRGPAPSNLTPTPDEAPGDLPIIYRQDCDPGYRKVAVRQCEYGDAASPTTVVLFGDSHAGQWFPAIEALATRHRWRLVVFTKSACSPASVLPYAARLNRPYFECEKWRERVTGRIRSLRPAVVVLASVIGGAQMAKGDPDRIWTDGWVSTIRGLKAEGTRLVLINDTPHPKTNIPECVSAHLDDVRACNSPAKDAVQQPQLRQKVAEAAAREGVAVVDPIDWFCATGTCPAVIGNVLVYRDASHITREYAAVLAPLVAARILSGS
jgi:peptidoglycan/LPS O-acetylase OafA/YrhL